jgi:hypothetical protein
MGTIIMTTIMGRADTETDAPKERANAR